MSTAPAKSTIRPLLDHFARIDDARPSHKVAYPLPEVLFLAVCATIAGCDDYEDIVMWGEERLDFLRRFRPYHWGIPCADWLRVLMNRVDPDTFQACFSDWVAEWFPAAPVLVAIDGKTSRRTHDKAKGRKALHLVSAWASHERLVLGQEAVDEKSNEIKAIPALLDRLSLAGALVTLDAMGCNPAIAAAIKEAGADYLLAVKDNQPTLHREVESYFDTAPADEIEELTLTDKGHGRIEIRRHVVSAAVEWMSGSRHDPGEPRLKGLATIGMVETRVERGGETSRERRFHVSSAPLSAARFATAVRGHWGIENQLHWVLDVQFREDQSRLRTGHGATNMAVVRHWAINLVRNADDKHSIKTRRKRAALNSEYLAALLSPSTR